MYPELNFLPSAPQLSQIPTGNVHKRMYIHDFLFLLLLPPPATPNKPISFFFGGGCYIWLFMCITVIETRMASEVTVNVSTETTGRVERGGSVQQFQPYTTPFLAQTSLKEQHTGYTAVPAAQPMVKNFELHTMSHNDRNTDVPATYGHPLVEEEGTEPSVEDQTNDVHVVNPKSNTKRRTVRRTIISPDAIRIFAIADGIITLALLIMSALSIPQVKTQGVEVQDTFQIHAMKVPADFYSLRLATTNVHVTKNDADDGDAVADIAFTLGTVDSSSIITDENNNSSNSNNNSTTPFSAAAVSAMIFNMLASMALFVCVGAGFIISEYALQSQVPSNKLLWTTIYGICMLKVVVAVLCMIAASTALRALADYANVSTTYTIQRVMMATIAYVGGLVVVPMQLLTSLYICISSGTCRLCCVRIGKVIQQ
jgi:hypothetical protein